MSQISFLVLLMMMAMMLVMMLMIMMVMLIMINIKVMNVKDIWLTSLNAIPQVKISFAAAYDFNQLIYAVCSLPWPLSALQI